MRHYQATMKHSGSCLSDLPFEVLSDDVQKEVTLQLKRFDSELIAEIVTRVLPREMGVTAFRDDSLGFIVPQPDYKLTIKVGNMAFKAQVVKLLSLGDKSRVSVAFGVPAN